MDGSARGGWDCFKHPPESHHLIGDNKTHVPLIFLGDEWVGCSQLPTRIRMLNSECNWHDRTVGNVWMISNIPCPDEIEKKAYSFFCHHKSTLIWEWNGQIYHTCIDVYFGGIIENLMTHWNGYFRITITHKLLSNWNQSWRLSMAPPLLILLGLTLCLFFFSLSLTHAIHPLCEPAIPGSLFTCLP